MKVLVDFSIERFKNGEAAYNPADDTWYYLKYELDGRPVVMWADGERIEWVTWDYKQCFWWKMEAL